MPSRRRLARVVVMQALFERNFHHSHPSDAPDPVLEEVLARNIEEQEKDAVDSGFAQLLLSGVQEHHSNILSTIQEHAPQWPLERMDAITRAILMVGAEELLFAGDAPPAVVMNEAIELAKEYGTEESRKFVNGVLNAIAHD